ncbi:hypothetical protein B566_EDAN008839 [Ephemera danica]|nr:hypothetical protein B566_EDAN008839 [Ephemera danica]
MNFGMTRIEKRQRKYIKDLIYHFADVHEIFNSNLISVIMISESWLKPFHNSSIVHISGYNLIRHDRVGKGGGGVCMYIAENIRAKVMYKSELNLEKPEFLIVEIIVNHTKIWLITVYRAPTISCLTEFENVLFDFVPNYENVIIGVNHTISDIMTDQPELNSVEKFGFNFVSVRDVRRAFYKIKSKARGVDKLSIDLLIPVLRYVLPPLTLIINKCIISSKFPCSWKKAIVRPIPKTSSPTSPADTRPISIISSIRGIDNLRTIRRITTSEYDRLFCHVSIAGSQIQPALSCRDYCNVARRLLEREHSPLSRLVVLAQLVAART